MKFIGGIHTFHFEENGISVKLPHYHRSSTGLFSNTTVYLYPRITKNVYEVLISPFHPINWAEIWKLELNSIDRPGLIKDITKVLREEKVNIFIQESLITNYNQDFTVSLIANFSDYFQKRGVRIGSQLTTEDADKYFKEIRTIFENVNENDAKEKIRVERFEQIKFLINNSKDVVMEPGNQVNLIDKETLNYYYQASYRGTKIESKSVLINQGVINHLELRKYANYSNTVQGTIFSDTEDKFILVRFFYANQLVVNLEITHDVTRCGVINEFTDKIQTADANFNIISCYSRISDDQNTALWYVLIDVTSNPEKIQDLIDELRKDTSIVYGVKALKYSDSILELVDKKQIELEESEYAKKQKLNLKSSNEKQLMLLRELKEEKNKALEKLSRDKEQIEEHVDRELKNTMIIFSTLIIFFLLVITSLFVLVQWEKLDPWMTFTPIMISGIATLYTVLKGIQLRLPANNEETKVKIREKWTIKRGYDLSGENTLEKQINNRKEEINKYNDEVRMLEDKLLK